MPEHRYVIRQEDHAQDWRTSRMAVEGLRRAARAARQDGKAREVIIREWRPPRTDPQRRTLWMWHGQVASELTVRTGRAWSKDDVHEVIFLPRWMPQRELIDPDTGEIITRPVRTSDRPPEDEDRPMKQIISEAMTAYLAWAVDMGIELTVPETGWQL